MNSRTQWSRRWRDRVTAVFAAAGVATLLAGSIVMGTAGAAQANHGDVSHGNNTDDFKISICHATGSGSNSYENGRGEVPKWEITGPGGHGSDVANHPNDIIPKFDAGSHGAQTWSAFSGRNLHLLAQLENNCEPLRVTPEIDVEDPCGTENDTVDGVAKPGYDFVVNGDTVTFTAKQGYQLVGTSTLRAEWTNVACDGASQDVPVEPKITWSDPCGTENDTVDGVENDGYTFTVNGDTVTFTAKAGYYLDGDSTLKAPWTNKPCDRPDKPTKVTPVVPEVDDSERCEVEGTFSIPDTWGVQYLLDGDPIEPGTYEGPVDGVLTAEAVGDTMLEDKDWHYDLVLDEAEECDEVLPGELTDVCPNIPKAQESVPDGYVLADGKCVKDTVKGVEDERPKPVVAPVAAPGGAPETAPVEAGRAPGAAPQVLPTSVDAGIGGPAASAGETSPGRSLVLAGAVMLVLAGSLQIGRRRRDALEA